MAKELRSVIVISNGKKIRIPMPNKVIIAVRDRKLNQHQASIDVNIPNINIMRTVITPEGIDLMKELENRQKGAIKIVRRET